MRNILLIPILIPIYISYINPASAHMGRMGRAQPHFFWRRPHPPTPPHPPPRRRQKKWGRARPIRPIWAQAGLIQEIYIGINIGITIESNIFGHIFLIPYEFPITFPIQFPVMWRFLPGRHHSAAPDLSCLRPRKPHLETGSKKLLVLETSVDHLGSLGTIWGPSFEEVIDFSHF